MPPEIVNPSAFSPDIQEFLRALDTHDVRFMIVGGEAVIFWSPTVNDRPVEPFRESASRDQDMVLSDCIDGAPILRIEFRPLRVPSREVSRPWFNRLFDERVELPMAL